MTTTATILPTSDRAKEIAYAINRSLDVMDSRRRSRLADARALRLGELTRRLALIRRYRRRLADVNARVLRLFVLADRLPSGKRSVTIGDIRRCLEYRSATRQRLREALQGFHNDRDDARSFLREATAITTAIGEVRSRVADESLRLADLGVVATFDGYISLPSRYYTISHGNCDWEYSYRVDMAIRHNGISVAIGGARHPHTSDSGEPCWGDASDLADDLGEGYRFADLFELAIAFIQSPLNESSWYYDPHGYCEDCPTIYDHYDCDCPECMRPEESDDDE